MPVASGEGKIFYFRPGHETHPIFTQELPLKVMENTVRWMSNSKISQLTVQPGKSLKRPTRKGWTFD